MQAPQHTNSISMIVPVFNEEEMIELFVEEAVSILKDFKKPFELIMVDDGSNDSTLNKLAKLAKKRPEIKLISLDQNTGIGNATIIGIKASINELVFWNTVDRVIDTKYCLTQALAEMANGYDIVTFYRKDLSANSIYQKIMTLGNNQLIKILFPWRFKAYQQFQFHNREFISRIIFESNSYFIVPELLFKARVYNQRIKEIPADYHKRTDGKPKGGRLKWVLKTFFDIWKCWFLWIMLKRPLLIKKAADDSAAN